ncbi:SIMPL domain-containing protein [Desulfocurvibacter africanus]|uniref:SIMPL domain-containing protein n=1 Tax=Desulfocurvibacter africanus TaxID=873 RepID=UPI000411F64B|nr:SIMPL domain-containing protein [Desulfocurvibacter africanus]
MPATDRTDRNPSIFFLGFFLAVGMVAAAWLLGHALTEFKAYDRYVTVKGLAEREVPADLAMWPISFNAAGDSLVQVQDDLTRQEKIVREFLRQQGLGDAEATLAAPRITDHWSMGMRPQDLPANRYSAQGVLTVRSGSPDKVKKAMAEAGKLVSQGVVLVHNYEYQPRFEFTKLNDIKPDMIAAATKDARAAADQFARDSGSSVGAIRRATQGYFSIDDRDPYTPEIKQIRVVTTVEYFLEN